MNLKQMLKMVRSSKGYTLDQTILIIAIIAILVTLIILTVGWSLINRASGTRLASQIGNVQDALGNYYGDVKQWPKSTTDDPAHTAAALAGFNDSNGSTKNYIAGLTTAASGVSHNLNSQTYRAVSIYQVPGSATAWTGPAGTTYEVVEFQNVAGSDFTNADNAIDSGDGGQAGSLRIIAATGTAPATTGGCFAAAPTFISPTVANTYYDVCYRANNVQ
jgi:type II secretory pathway pseudopilin PulG